jgi:hypothetical protein
LLDAAGHPEVVVAGAPLAPAKHLLDAIAMSTLEGEGRGLIRN